MSAVEPKVGLAKIECDGLANRAALFLKLKCIDHLGFRATFQTAVGGLVGATDGFSMVASYKQCLNKLLNRMIIQPA